MLDLGSLKIGIDVDDKGVKSKLQGITGDVETTTSQTTKKVSKMSATVKKAVAAIGTAAVVKKVVDLGKAAVNAYAEYEQLTGGIETLFGKSADTVMQYADKAYMTAGVSANKYMELTTSFSASLINSLGGDTAKAAEYSNRAIVDMSDNANKMGSSIESIQNAYQGFAKQNYTMLDNLKLGYGGTKSEMERLLADAEKLTGKKFDISNFGDIVQAIHAIQEEMGITGTTSEEAADTIEGSVNSMKASWQNWLTALGSGEDVDVRTQELMTSVENVVRNMVPVIAEVAKGMFDGVATAIQEELDEVKKKIKKFIKEHETEFTIAATVIGALAVALIAYNAAAIGAAISSGAQTVALGAMIAAETAASVATTALGAAFAFLTSPITLVIAAIAAVIAIIVLCVKNWDKIKKKFKQGIKAIVNSKAFDTARAAIQKLCDWWDKLKEKAKKIITFKTKTTSKAEDSGYPKRIGLKEVPYDNYPALLHRGETVLTAAETNQYRNYVNGLEKMKTLAEGNATVNNETQTTYHIGDITLDVSSLKDIPTIEDFVNMITRVKKFA